MLLQGKSLKCFIKVLYKEVVKIHGALKKKEPGKRTVTLTRIKGKNTVT